MWQSNVNALIEMKLEKHKNLMEEAGFFWWEISEGTLKFDRKEHEVWRFTMIVQVAQGGFPHPSPRCNLWEPKFPSPSPSPPRSSTGCIHVRLYKKKKRIHDNSKFEYQTFSERFQLAFCVNSFLTSLLVLGEKCYDEVTILKAVTTITRVA